MTRQQNSPVPLYYQVQQDLASSIASGALPPGAQLPTEDELIRRYGMSRTTVRKAIQELERLGLIEIRRGRGTFVRADKLAQEFAELTGFVEDMVEMGVRPSARLLGAAPSRADEAVARQLRVPIGAEVMHIRRVRLGDGVPMSLDETFLPIDLGRKVAGDDLEVYPIFSLLEKKYDTPLVEADYRVEAVSAAPGVAEALEVVEGSPILLIERVSYTTGGRPVDFETLHYRGDRIKLTTRLRRRPSTIPLDTLPKIAPDKH